MESKLNDFQALLLKLRDDFLGEIPDRCNRLDDLILALEKSPGSRELFNELFRGVHSLKGSGGTHGLSIVTTICHQMENLLTETEKNMAFGSDFASKALAYVDLLRRVEKLAYDNKQNFSAIETALDALHHSVQSSRKYGLIAESSPMMSQYYQQALDSLSLQLTVVDNGLVALQRLLHEPYDFVIAGRETKELNGVALMLALRASHTRNANIPAILVSSKADKVPAYAEFSAALSRDKQLASNLLASVKSILKI